MNSRQLAIFFLLFCTVGCVDSYSPNILESGKDYLVVDGYIDSGTGASTIRLTHTLEIKDAGKALIEKGAVLTLEGTDQSKFKFIENPAGVYSIAQLNLNHSEKYQLRIKTKDQSEYVSDLLSPKTTPPVDKIEWTASNDGLQIYVSTHDPSNNTRYYQWEFEETWHYQSAFCTNLEYKNKRIVYMDPYINIHDCWRSAKPVDNILVGTSSRLTNDVISKFPLTYVAASSGKVGIMYSILVKQHALSKSGFDYYEKLKKNTEQLGSIFDPQPSALTGNIHSVTDDKKVVIGFFDIFNVEEKRIFISNRDLPETFMVLQQDYCYNFEIDSTSTYVQDLIGFYENGLIMPIIPTDSTRLVFTILNTPYAPRGCVDCRAAGTNVKPSYWPDVVGCK
jgi:hypothetical protein